MQTISTVKENQETQNQKPLAVDWFKKICLEEGADDMGTVEIDRPALDSEREGILHVFPRTRTVISLV